ncbi:MAG: hypothetical protein ACRCYO_10540 [Bacteroidia bacterium]
MYIGIGMEERQKINLRIVPQKAELFSDQDGISWIVVLPDVELNLEDVTTIRSRGMETYNPEKPFYVLVDMREVADISAEAREYVAGKESAKYHSAMAMVVSSMAARILGNVYIRMNRPERPTKLFNDIDAAHVWLLEQAKK